ncbi:MAG: hypothetical protein WC785_06315 [Tatlockia sp.]|jgi:hypothetical protein
MHNAVTTLLAKRPLFKGSPLFNHEATALLLRHKLANKTQVFFLAGSEDLRAILPKLRLENEGDEAFLLLCPYIHSMALYIGVTNNQIQCYLFDPQNWGLRYYPTRLMLEAINQQYPFAHIYLTNAAFQPQAHNTGCTHYSLEFLFFCATRSLHKAIRLTDSKPLFPYLNCYHLGSDALPEEVTHLLSGNNYWQWIEQKENEHSAYLNAILTRFYLDNTELDWEKIDIAVHKAQGLELTHHKVSPSFRMYDLTIDAQQHTLTVQFKDQNFLYGNCYLYSEAIFPSQIDKMGGNAFILLANHKKITVKLDVQNNRLIYSASTLSILQNAFDQLHNPKIQRRYRERNLRQQAALHAIAEDVRHAFELHAVCQNNSGGLDSFTVQSALQYYLGQEGVYIPPITEYPNLKHIIKSLWPLGFHAMAFSFQTTKDHQVAIWLELHENAFVAHSYDSHQIRFAQKQALLDFLGLEKGELSIHSAQSPYPVQKDNWSCGVSVIRNLLFHVTQTTCNLSLEALASQTLWAAQAAMQAALTQHENALFHQNVKQSLLATLETFCQQYPIPNGECFKPLIQFLQMECFGRLRNQNISVEEDTLATNSLIASRPLTSLLHHYPTKDVHGTLFLQIASLLQEEPKLTDYLFNALRLTVKQHRLSLNLRSAVTGEHYSSRPTKKMSEALLFDVNEANAANLKTAIKCLLQRPSNLQECLNALEVEYPLDAIINTNELAFILLKMSVNSLLRFEEGNASEKNRKTIELIAYESQKIKVIRELEHHLDSPVSKALSNQLDPVLAVLPFLIRYAFSHLSPEENKHFLTKLIEHNVRTTEFKEWATLLDSEQLIRILSELSENERMLAILSKDKEENRFFHRFANSPMHIAKILCLFSFEQRLILLSVPNRYGETLLHFMADSPEMLEAVFNCLKPEQYLNALNLRSKFGIPVFHFIAQWILSLKKILTILPEALHKQVASMLDIHDRPVLHEMMPFPESLAILLAIYPEVLRIKDADNNLALHRAMLNLKSLEIVLAHYALQDLMQDLFLKNDSRQTPLHFAFQCSEALERLFSYLPLEKQTEVAKTIPLQTLFPYSNSLQFILNFYTLEALLETLKLIYKNNKALLYYAIEYPDVLTLLFERLSLEQRIEVIPVFNPDITSIFHYATKYPQSLKLLFSVYSEQKQKEIAKLVDKYGTSLLQESALNEESFLFLANLFDEKAFAAVLTK